MPDSLDDIALQAVALRVAQLAYAFQADMVEAMADDGVLSFSVPGYSETRREPTAVFRSGLVNPWPLLHELLWLLMTPEKRDEWTETMTNAPTPAFSVSEVDWSWPVTWRDWEQP